MYIEVTKNKFIDAFRLMGRYEAWSYEGLATLYDYLIELEDGSGEEQELDVIALDCEWTESTVEDAIREYDLASLEELERETTVLKIDEECIVYANF